MEGGGRFEETLGYGKEGEARVGDWLCGRGWGVVATGDIESGDGLGPRMRMGERGVVLPDMLVFRGGEARWVEVKRKRLFPWNRTSGCWVAGIDLGVYGDYKRVEEETRIPVWLMFLVEESVGRSPVGLWGRTIGELGRMESHRSQRHGARGMVYWEQRILHKVARLEDVKCRESGDERGTGEGGGGTNGRTEGTGESTDIIREVFGNASAT